MTRRMRNSVYIFLLIIALLTGVAMPGRCQLPDNIRDKDLVFVYVHGFGEFKKVPPFEEKMREFLQPLPLKTSVFTYRWDWLKLDLTKVVWQWTQAKQKADQSAKSFLDDVVLELEAAKIPYCIVAYSLGTRVVAKSLEQSPAPLKFLRGIYFLGSALPHTYVVDGTALPEGMNIINYYSPYLDEALKISFYNAEGVKAGGEVGFDDTTRVRNYRTVCTHVHKGGPLQRDYANLAPAIGYLSLFNEGIFVKGLSADFNLEMPVGSGSFHWNDIIEFDRHSHPLLIQQNVNTGHYRAVAIDEEESRNRKAWDMNLHTILAELQLFSPPYKQIIQQKD